MSISIREIRQLQGKSIETVASETKVSITAIKNWETGFTPLGNIKLKNAISLCESLGIKMDALISKIKND